VDVPLSTSTVLATRDQLFSANEQLALAGGQFSAVADTLHSLGGSPAGVWTTSPWSGTRRLRQGAGARLAGGLRGPKSAATAATSSSLIQDARTRTGASRSETAYPTPACCRGAMSRCPLG
jgi:hypothetical protein